MKKAKMLRHRLDCSYRRSHCKFKVQASLFLQWQRCHQQSKVHTLTQAYHFHLSWLCDSNVISERAKLLMNNVDVVAACWQYHGFLLFSYHMPFGSYSKSGLLMDTICVGMTQSVIGNTPIVDNVLTGLKEVEVGKEMFTNGVEWDISNGWLAARSKRKRHHPSVVALDYHCVVNTAVDYHNIRQSESKCPQQGTCRSFCWLPFYTTADRLKH